MEIEKKESYEYLLEHYKIDVIKNRLLYWHNACNKVIQKAGIEKTAVINQDALLRMILCYFTDIVRVKEFHGIQDVNESKKYAYGAFWFLRFHPIHLTDPRVNSKYTYINEKVVLNVIVSEFLASKDNGEMAKQYVRHLFHHLKYRSYNARTLELALDALNV